MSKVFEALKHLLPDESLKDVSEAVAGMLDEAKKEIESEFADKLEEAYAELAQELGEAEKTAEKGYQDAWGMIQDLRNRLETQKDEFESALEEGYEEAYEMLKGEKHKNDNISTELYEEFDKRLADMKVYIVEKVDEFLKHQGASIYEQARRDVLNDPRMAEHKVALDKIVDIAVGYASDEDFAFANSSKVEEMTRNYDQLRSQLRLVEGRNVRLATENTRLSEQVRATSEVIAEARQYNMSNSRKERALKAKNASGRGKIVNEGYIPEHRATKDTTTADNNAINEHNSPELYQMQVLAGVKQAN